jgi:hypothetical protein
LKITLGADGKAFFATDGRDYLWDLPTTLDEAVTARIKDGKWTEVPRIVSLGVEGNFVFITQNNSMVWDLGKYPDIAPAMKDFADGSNIKMISVSISIPSSSTISEVHRR